MRNLPHHEEDLKAFASRFKGWMFKVYKNRKLAADALDIHPTQMDKYTRGASYPSGPVVAKLGECGCNLNWLFNGEGLEFADTESGRLAKSMSLHRQSIINHKGKNDVAKTSRVIVLLDSVESLEAPVSIKNMVKAKFIDASNPKYTEINEV